jgi:hypothetical protein
MRARFRLLLCGVAVLAAAVSASPAAAAEGDIYLSDEDSALGPGSGGIFKLTPSGAVSVLATDPTFDNPGGLTLLPSGSLAVPDFGSPTNRIAVVDTASGAVSTLVEGPPLDNPYDAAMASDGSLFVADHGADRLFKVNLSTRAITAFAVLPNTGFGATVAPLRDGGAIVGIQEGLHRVSPAGVVTPLNTTSPLLNYVYDFVLTPDERVAFAANAVDDEFSRTDVATGTTTPFATLDESRTAALRPDGSFLLGETDGSIFNVPAAGAPLTPLVTDPRFAYVRGIAIEPARCAGRLPTVVGTTGNDVLTGSAFPDVFAGLGGKDRINSTGGNDVICGGPGNDVLRGGPANDRLLGQAGRDKLIGGKGRKDRVKGGKGKDVEKP